MSFLSILNTLNLPASSAKTLGAGQRFERDPFAPNYEIIVRGGIGAQPIGLDESVTQYIDGIIFEDNADQFDLLTITFNNQMDGQGGGDILSLIDSKLFAEGTILEIRMGWGKSLRTIGAAQIVKKIPNYAEDGVNFVLEGYDLLHNAAKRRPKGGVSYASFRDSQIASIIGERNGFDIAIKDPKSFSGIRRTKGVFDRIQKKGVSDYEFLKKVAEINAFDVFSRFDTDRKKFALFFQPAAVTKQKEVHTFIYNEGEASYVDSLLSFQPTLDAFGQSTDFEIFVIKNKQTGGTRVDFIKKLNTEENSKFKAENQRRFTGGNFGPEGGKQSPSDDGIQVAFKAFGRSFRFPRHKRFKDEAAAKAEIERFIKRQKENFITGSGTILGKETVQSRQSHNLTGLGDQFSGKYYFTKVVHRMVRGEGYMLDFTCRKTIDDFVVQATPGLELTENDKTLQKIKKLS